MRKATSRAARRCTASVDTERRLDIARNHTATHLLHKALRDVLGEHAQQRGSLVAPERLRFDFAHLTALSEEEILDIERRVNAAVRANYAVGTATMSQNEARQAGATMLFGEKYGEVVRMVSVGDDYQPRALRRHAPARNGRDRLLCAHQREQHRRGPAPHRGGDRPRRRSLRRASAWAC